jgi:hypothetical protein
MKTNKEHKQLIEDVKSKLLKSIEDLKSMKEEHYIDETDFCIEADEDGNVKRIFLCEE